MALVRRVREVQHVVFLQSPCCYHGIHQRVVEVQLVYGERHPPVQAAHQDATPAVVVVLVPDVDEDATVRHLHGLQRHTKGGKNRWTPLFTSLAALAPRPTDQHQVLSPRPHSLQAVRGGSDRT